MGKLSGMGMSATGAWAGTETLVETASTEAASETAAAATDLVVVILRSTSIDQCSASGKERSDCGKANQEVILYRCLMNISSDSDIEPSLRRSSIDWMDSFERRMRT
jgi:hypothetical protein